MKNSSAKRTHIIEFVVFLLILVGIVVYLIVAGSGKKESGVSAEVTYKGQVVYSLNLNEDQTQKVITQEGEVVINVKGGKIAVTSSPCPNQYCVGQGYKSKAGDSIICAHEGVVVLIKGDEAVEEIHI